MNRIVPGTICQFSFTFVLPHLWFTGADLGEVTTPINQSFTHILNLLQVHSNELWLYLIASKYK